MRTWHSVRAVLVQYQGRCLQRGHHQELQQFFQCSLLQVACLLLNVLTVANPDVHDQQLGKVHLSSYKTGSGSCFFSTRRRKMNLNSFSIRFMEISRGDVIILSLGSFRSLILSKDLRTSFDRLTTVFAYEDWERGAGGMSNERISGEGACLPNIRKKGVT